MRYTNNSYVCMSVHAKVLPWTICLPTLVLIAQAVFLLECRQTKRQTDATERPTHAGCGSIHVCTEQQ